MDQFNMFLIPNNIKKNDYAEASFQSCVMHLLPFGWGRVDGGLCLQRPSVPPHHQAGSHCWLFVEQREDQTKRSLENSDQQPVLFWGVFLSPDFLDKESWQFWRGFMSADSLKKSSCFLDIFEYLYHVAYIISFTC